MTSRLSKVCQRERGSKVSVTSSPSSCGGVEKTSDGVSRTTSAAKPSKAIQLYQIYEICAPRREKNVPSLSASPCIEGRDTSVISSSATV
jgi:hypothetical protein